MNFLRPTTTRLTRTLLLRPTTITTTPAFSTSIPKAYAQGYGDGKGDPKASDPEAQGASNPTKEAAEHPGPAPPAEGKGTGGATKGGSGSASKESGAGEKGKRSFSTFARMRKEEDGLPSNGAKPKISDKGKPGEDLSAEKKEEVERHNREFDEKHDKARDSDQGKK